MSARGVPLCLAPLAPVASLAKGVCRKVLTPCTPAMRSTCGPVGTFTAGPNPYGIAFDGTNMWVANTDLSVDGGAGDVTVLSTEGMPPRTIPFPQGSNPYAIAFDGTNMWVASIDGNVVALSSNGDMTGLTFHVGTTPKGIAFDGTTCG